MRIRVLPVSILIVLSGCKKWLDRRFRLYPISDIGRRLSMLLAKLVCSGSQPGLFYHDEII
jgi:hypothetical protein